MSDPATPPPGAMVPAPQPVAPVPAKPAWDLTSGANDFWTNLDPADPEQAQLILRCRGIADAKGRELVGQVLSVRWTFAAPREKTDKETGEIAHWICSCLISPDGKVYSFGSGGVLGSLKNIVGLKGIGPYDPPLAVKVRQTDMGEGKSLLTLDLVNDVATLKTEDRKRGR